MPKPSKFLNFDNFLLIIIWISTDTYVCTCLSIYSGVNCATPVNPCLNNLCNPSTSQCIPIPGTTTYTCACNLGYRGVFCAQKISFCESNPCLYGNCTDTATGYLCSCSFGWTGPQCNVQVLACSALPCLNGGTCYDFSGSRYLCVCQTGFAGN